jgi:hypothetical protein
MRWITYIPGHSTLLFLYKAARVRLMVNSANVGDLSDKRIASATEEINQISDDIRDAKVGDASDRASVPAGPDIALPSTVAVAGALRPAPVASPEQPPSKFIALDVSAEAGDGVQWVGEYDALAGRREKGAFVSQLTALGYAPGEFRVTVRRVSPDGPGDSRQRYTVLVGQLRNGTPYRGKRYSGGHGADWIDQFAREAAVDFPRNVGPAATSGGLERTKGH